MWIVRVALDRPYIFIVFALMIVILSGGDHVDADGYLPEHDIPVSAGVAIAGGCGARSRAASSAPVDGNERDLS